jgi:hypothetical protein
MGFIFQSSNLVLGDTEIVYGESREVVELSFVSEVLEVFDMGYYMLTGKTPQEEGWIPRDLSEPAFEAVADECCPDQPGLKRAPGFCCLVPDSGRGLEVIVRGNESLPVVLLTLAHETGHATKEVLDPDQRASGLDTNTAATHEAQARELLANSILSPESLFLVHQRLVNLPARSVESYAADLLFNVGDFHTTMTGTLADRLSRSVPVAGFIKYDLTTALVP